MPIEVRQPVDQSIEQFAKEGKPFIVHSPTGTFDAYNIRLTPDSMSFTPQTLEGFKILRFKKGKRVDYYYTTHPARKRNVVENEVHVFTSYPLGIVKDPVKTVPINSMTKVERLRFDKKKTTSRHIVTAGIITGVAAIAIIVTVAATSPFTWGTAGTPLF